VIDHVKLIVSDYETSKRFFEQALGPLGYRVVFEAEGLGYFADANGLDFGVGVGEPGGGTHVGFAVGDTATVHAFYEAALAAGGRDNGAPGLRPEYAADYYSAYVLDLDGNNIEAFCHTEE